MIIKNLTSKLQPLKVKELAGGREFTLYVEGHGEVEIERGYIPISISNKVFEILNTTSAPIFDKEPEYQEIIEENKEVESDEIIIDEEEEKPVPKEVDDKFICDICGAEFASARGLNSHKNRAHSEESNK